MEEFWLNPFVWVLFFISGIFLAGVVRGFLEGIGAIAPEVSQEDKERMSRQQRIDALYGRYNPGKGTEDD